MRHWGHNYELNAASALQNLHNLDSACQYHLMEGRWSLGCLDFHHWCVHLMMLGVNNMDLIKVLLSEKSLRAPLAGKEEDCYLDGRRER